MESDHFLIEIEGLIGNGILRRLIGTYIDRTGRYLQK